MIDTNLHANMTSKQVAGQRTALNAEPLAELTDQPGGDNAAGFGLAA
jgi:hypothetical protein